ncbi:translation elongation factor Ts [Thermosynechococcus sp. QKsg1]|uniref:translation elongation factor Ts n=1 Tax=unclassified Thermosynechococcus TaxID=2622553 RepID=UPI00122DF048|nr:MULTISPECIES: translation elongation factor Ts [unclassified Thermosynechococcus]QEQ00897.1 translation elongation factor Ts [Thermosynechococcus sp. CL-1]WJI25155.1 translation elongation factor Ts [Thermosynechococcus sp. B0]WJI30216.1 translation elongation factor Ts [Thermosynechococcus sp. B3]WKT84798.1 translation elongation factor Ts [Thermosynechococcus sp. HY596]WNC63933.1 translation elongation factor Ts [Thermosynechococcus sp. HY591]
MAEISAKLVKELRDKTGAGMMDCKKALQESNGDMEAAIAWLRQKGLASAGKKAGRVTSEGLVDSYIHTGGRIGVLVEVNCETDFVARNEKFKALVQDIAKQIAACPNVEFVSIDDIPEEYKEKERQIALGSDALKGKPPEVKEKIVAGKLEKTLKELCLLNQPFIRDQSKTVEELVKEHIAELGENIQIRRFQRFVLGEGIEKQETNLAEEVAAQTQAMSAAAKTAEAPAEVAETATPEVSAPEPAAETTPDEPAPEPVAVSEQTVEPVAEPAAESPDPVAEPTAESKGFGAAAKKSGGKSRTAKKKK